jgi:hypothetical protein
LKHLVAEAGREALVQALAQVCTSASRLAAEPALLDLLLDLLDLQHQRFSTCSSASSPRQAGSSASRPHLQHLDRICTSASRPPSHETPESSMLDAPEDRSLDAHETRMLDARQSQMQRRSDATPAPMQRPLRCSARQSPMLGGHQDSDALGGFAQEMGAKDGRQKPRWALKPFQSHKSNISSLNKSYQLFSISDERS